MTTEPRAVDADPTCTKAAGKVKSMPTHASLMNAGMSEMEGCHRGVMCVCVTCGRAKGREGKGREGKGREARTDESAGAGGRACAAMHATLACAAADPEAQRGTAWGRWDACAGPGKTGQTVSDAILTAPEQHHRALGLQDRWAYQMRAQPVKQHIAK